MRDRWLQGVEAVVERQQGVPTKATMTASSPQPRAPWSEGPLGPVRRSAVESALPPLGDGLWVDAVAGRQRFQARLTMLYRSTTAAVVVALPW